MLNFSKFKNKTPSASNDLIQNKKIEDLEKFVKYLKEKNADKDFELKELETQKADEIKELKENIIQLETSTLSSDLEKQKLENKLEEKEEKIKLLEERVEYLEQLVEKYRQLPDLKNMIDNLSSLTTPSIDKLSEILKNNDFETMTKIVELLEKMSTKITNVANKIDETDYKLLAYFRRHM